MPVRAELRPAYQGGSTPLFRNGPPVHKVWRWMPSTLCNINYLAPPPEDELEKTLMNATVDLTATVHAQLDPAELKKWQRRGCQERKRTDFYTGFRKLVGETGHHRKNGGTTDWVAHAMNHESLHSPKEF